ncbi:MAG: hypothetical protein AAFX44_17625 [Pseudomonadota bacterium]
MIEQETNALPGLDSFLTRVDSDLTQLRVGQQHAMICVVLGKADNDHAFRFDGAEIDRIRGEIPTKATTYAIAAKKLIVWLPRCTRDEAMTLARLLRVSVTNAGAADAGNVLLPVDVDGQRACAIGVVFANQSNWQADALLRTADVTASLALVSNANTIKVAEQLRRSPRLVD